MKIKFDELLSSFAFNFNLRLYILEEWDERMEREREEGEEREGGDCDGTMPKKSAEAAVKAMTLKNPDLQKLAEALVGARPQLHYLSSALLVRPGTDSFGSIVIWCHRMHLPSTFEG